MKSIRVLLLSVSCIGLLAAFAALKPRMALLGHAPFPVVIPQPAAAAPSPAPAAPPAAPPAATVTTAAKSQAEKIIHVQPDRVLTVVNGVPLTLKDLAAPEGTAGQTMSLEMFTSLLKQAVGRELAFQVARAQQVTLTHEQQERLKELRAALEQSRPERVEFELRDATSLMLQANLAARSGLPPPIVNAAREQQYTLR